jgi:hypothetical protein
MFPVIEDLFPAKVWMAPEAGVRLTWGGWCRGLAHAALADDLASVGDGRRIPCRPERSASKRPPDQGSEEQVA